MPDFCWSNYLEETGSVAAPSLLFKHVRISAVTMDVLARYQLSV